MALNKLDLVKWFLTQDAMDPGVDKNRALNIALQDGYYDIAECLLADSRVDAGVNQNFPVLTAISFRDHRLLEMLLANEKVRLNDEDDTIIAAAVELGDYFILEHLLTKTQPAAKYNFALRLALRKRDLRMIKMLLPHANVSVNVPWHFHPLFPAIETGSLEIVRILTEHPGFREETARIVILLGLDMAHKRKFPEIATFLLGLPIGAAQPAQYLSFPQKYSFARPQRLNLEPRKIARLIQRLLNGAVRVAKLAHHTVPPSLHRYRQYVLRQMLDFSTIPNRQKPESLQSRERAVSSYIDSLLGTLFANEQASGRGYFKPTGFEFMRLMYDDLRYGISQRPQEEVKKAFKIFLIGKPVSIAQPVVATNARPNLKRKREDSEVDEEVSRDNATGEQDVQGSTEKVSSETSNRAIRGRLNPEGREEMTGRNVAEGKEEEH